MTPPQIAEAQELAFEWTAEHRRVRRLRALLEGMPFKLGNEAPERLSSCLIKFRRSQAICRVRESSAALAFMASFLRIGAQNLLVAR
jgi:hypothetical protein